MEEAAHRPEGSVRGLASVFEKLSQENNSSQPTRRSNNLAERAAFFGNRTSPSVSEPSPIRVSETTNVSGMRSSPGTDRNLAPPISTASSASSIAPEGNLYNTVSLIPQIPSAVDRNISRPEGAGDAMMCSNSTDNLASPDLITLNAAPASSNPQCRLTLDGENAGEYIFEFSVQDMGSERVLSDVFCIGNFNWRLLVFPRGDSANPNSGLGAYLEAADTDRLPPTWTKSATASLALISRKWPELKPFKKFEHTFDSRNRSWGHNCLVPLQEFTDNEKAYIIDGKAVIKAHVKVLGVAETDSAQTLATLPPQGRASSPATPSSSRPTANTDGTNRLSPLHGSSVTSPHPSSYSAPRNDQRLPPRLSQGSVSPPRGGVMTIPSPPNSVLQSRIARNNQTNSQGGYASPPRVSTVTSPPCSPTVHNLFFNPYSTCQNCVQLREKIELMEVAHRLEIEDLQMQLALMASRLQEEEIWNIVRNGTAARAEASRRGKASFEELEAKLKEQQAKYLAEQERTEREKECKICCVAEIQEIFLPCGHVCVCSDCAATIFSGPEHMRKCPMCRRPCQSITKVYFS